MNTPQNDYFFLRLTWLWLQKQDAFIICWLARPGHQLFWINRVICLSDLDTQRIGYPEIFGHLIWVTLRKSYQRLNKFTISYWIHSSSISSISWLDDCDCRGVLFLYLSMYDIYVILYYNVQIVQCTIAVNFCKIFFPNCNKVTMEIWCQNCLKLWREAVP